MVTHRGVFLNRFFPATFERDPKHIQLPPGINTNRETIFKILHNNHLLVQILWPGSTIRSTNYAPITTIFALEKPATIAPLQKKATYTSFVDGFSVLGTLGPVGYGYLIRWTVTETTTGSQVDETRGPCTAVKRRMLSATAPGHYSLEETCTIFFSESMMITIVVQNG